MSMRSLIQLTNKAYINRVCKMTIKVFKMCISTISTIVYMCQYLKSYSTLFQLADCRLYFYTEVAMSLLLTLELIDLDPKTIF